MNPSERFPLAIHSPFRMPRSCARRSDDTDAFCRNTVRAPVPSGPRSRLYRHCDELFTFLDDPRVPADNNGTERDIRSLAAARSDGGTHRADWSAAAFARLKSVIVTGMKNQVRFIQYGIEVVRAKLRGERRPLPLATAPDTG